MMAKIVLKFVPLLLLAVVGVCTSIEAQQSGNITVGGNFNTFYPVTWLDGGWSSSRQTELDIGRSFIHTNSQFRGSVLASFKFHVTDWGHQSHFINAHIVNSNSGNPLTLGFIAGWEDSSNGNQSRRIIIWLRGGGTTYYYNANYNVSPIVYDGIQNSLPYVTHNGSHTYNEKSEVDLYVKVSGTVLQHPLHLRGGNSAIMGNLGIGTTVPTHRLEVNGTIRAKEVKLEAINWPDYVFEKGYELMPLEEVKSFIDQKGHLPGLKSAKEYEQEGVNMLELNQKLLEKVEELTLHILQLEQKFQKVNRLEAELEYLKKIIREIP
ncbi:hypothetical protein MM239_04865 [Belliella sp. DSM 111904]|uniref:Uncharacterized protein n=1 Tax=Belliella filtrata TaxID=2923435 RepID=A0ABS9UYA1_9BACT|nr:hypothetical protein [Belliella filtrata]MCH7408715.1 hypothetical protein [Belliella filtrata]